MSYTPPGVRPRVPPARPVRPDGFVPLIVVCARFVLALVKTRCDDPLRLATVERSCPQRWLR